MKSGTGIRCWFIKNVMWLKLVECPKFEAYTGQCNWTWIQWTMSYLRWVIFVVLNVRLEGFYMLLQAPSGKGQLLLQGLWFSGKISVRSFPPLLHQHLHSKQQSTLDMIIKRRAMTRGDFIQLMGNNSSFITTLQWNTDPLGSQIIETTDDTFKSTPSQ